jgi:hypothetical protein
MLRASRRFIEATSESRLEQACSHYKDTYEVHLGTLRQRDVLFYVLLGAAAAFTLQAASPETANSALTEYLANAVGIKVSKDSRLLDSLLWFLLLGASTRYFQLNVQIERQYDYLHGLESYLSRHFHGTMVFTREGASYLGNYPLFSNWIWLLYTIAFPILLLAAITVRISQQLSSSQQLAPIGFDIACYFLVGTSTILYLLRMHRDWIKAIAVRLWRK